MIPVHSPTVSGSPTVASSRFRCVGSVGRFLPTRLLYFLVCWIRRQGALLLLPCQPGRVGPILALPAAVSRFHNVEGLEVVLGWGLGAEPPLVIVFFSTPADILFFLSINCYLTNCRIWAAIHPSEDELWYP